jgi:hypothetical protein
MTALPLAALVQRFFIDRPVELSLWASRRGPRGRPTIREIPARDDASAEKTSSGANIHRRCPKTMTGALASPTEISRWLPALLDGSRP